LVFVLAGMFLSALVTDLIGIHGLFGAFVWGLVLPTQGRLVDSLRTWLDPLVQTLFLPLFFVCSGLHTRVDLLASLHDWVACTIVIAIATVGKFGGTYWAARYSRIAHLDALALGALMNTRGLVGLIVLDVGFQLGLLSERLFAMLVIMALVTTFAATPLLDQVLRRSKQQAVGATVMDAVS
jgi:Kef-type K+ transport system membrane component KefB